MSKRDIRLYLHDMLNAISKVERFTAGLDYERFESNEMVIDAVVRNLEVIGEAARNIPPGFASAVYRDRMASYNWLSQHCHPCLFCGRRPNCMDYRHKRSAPVETSPSEHAGAIGGRLVILWGSLG